MVSPKRKTPRTDYATVRGASFCLIGYAADYLGQPERITAAYFFLERM